MTRKPRKRRKALIRFSGRLRRIGRAGGTAFQKIRTNPAYLAFLLGAFSLIGALALSSAFMATEAAIDMRLKEDLQKSLSTVIPANLHDNDLVASSFELKSENGGMRRLYPAYWQGQLRAVAYQTTALGYGGQILVLLGVDRDGTLLGVRVLQHAETPGLGDKIEANRSNWIKTFDGLSLGALLPTEWKVKKDGGHFDQFSGATITPRAVVKSVEQGLKFFEKNKPLILARPAMPQKG